MSTKRRSGGTRNDAQFGFGLADLGIGSRNAIVSGHGDFQSTAEGGSVNRHHHRLGAVFDRQQQGVKRRQFGMSWKIAYRVHLSGYYVARTKKDCFTDF